VVLRALLALRSPRRGFGANFVLADHRFPIVGRLSGGLLFATTDNPPETVAEEPPPLITGGGRRITLVSTFAVNRRSLKGVLSRQIALTLGKVIPGELSRYYRARRDVVNRV